jgi:hypothetical protein
MAKKEKSVVNVSLLSAIDGGARVANDAATLALLNHNPPLIGVHTDDLDPETGLAKAWLTDAGKAALPNGHAVRQEVAKSDTPRYAVVDNGLFVPSEKKRGGRGGGAPIIYPWDSLEVGKFFFVGVSDKPDPFKSMQSAVSSANMKYSEEVGEEKPHTRTKRGPGNKAVVDANGNNVKETIMRRERKQLRKFELRAVKKGEAFGGWSAPEDGVIVGRTL